MGNGTHARLGAGIHRGLGDEGFVIHRRDEFAHAVHGGVSLAVERVLKGGGQENRDEFSLRGLMEGEATCEVLGLAVFLEGEQFTEFHG